MRERFIQYYVDEQRAKDVGATHYHIFNALQRRYEMSREQLFWFAFLEAIEYGPHRLWATMHYFPYLETTKADPLERFERKLYRELGLDPDRRHNHPPFLTRCFEQYKLLLNG